MDPVIALLLWLVFVVGLETWAVKFIKKQSKEDRPLEEKSEEVSQQKQIYQTEGSPSVF